MQFSILKVENENFYWNDMNRLLLNEIKLFLIYKDSDLKDEDNIEKTEATNFSYAYLSSRWLICSVFCQDLINLYKLYSIFSYQLLIFRQAKNLKYFKRFILELILSKSQLHNLGYSGSSLSLESTSQLTLRYSQLFLQSFSLIEKITDIILS